MSAHLCVSLQPPGDCHRCDLERDTQGELIDVTHAEALPVTCDGCPARSEAGWGDTPLCLDCQRVDDPSLVCEKHQLTRVPDEPCPVCRINELELEHRCTYEKRGSQISTIYLCSDCRRCVHGNVGGGLCCA